MIYTDIIVIISRGQDTIYLAKKECGVTGTPKTSVKVRERFYELERAVNVEFRPGEVRLTLGELEHSSWWLVRIQARELPDKVLDFVKGHIREIDGKGDGFSFFPTFDPPK